MDISLQKLGITSNNLGTSTGTKFFASGDKIDCTSPVDGSLIGTVTSTTIEDYEKVIKSAQSAFTSFRKMPAPKRGDMVRQFGNRLRELKEPLGMLVSIKISPAFFFLLVLCDLCENCDN